jgi:hypothetical protein
MGLLGAAQAVVLSNPEGQHDRHLLGLAGAVQRGHRSTSDEDGSGSGSGDDTDDIDSTTSVPRSTPLPPITLPATTLSTTVSDEDVAQGSSNIASLSSSSSSSGTSGAATAAGVVFGLVGMLVLMSGLAYLTERQQALLDGDLVFFSTPTHQQVGTNRNQAMVTIRNPVMDDAIGGPRAMPQEETAI